jgi:hypothetical protein
MGLMAVTICEARFRISSSAATNPIYT